MNRFADSTKALPKTLSKFATKVIDYEDGRKYGGSILVTLAHGLCVEYSGLHTIAADSVRDVAAQLQRAMVCECDSCR